MTIKYWPLALITALLLSACGSDNNSPASGTSGSNATTSSTGTVQIAVTDAEDDFLTYRITLDSITLVRADGTEVDVLPTATEVDFVQYQQLSELFAMASVPVGNYSSILLNLDYSNADIVIQDADGITYDATAVDSNGNTLSTLQLTLELTNGDVLEVADGEISALTLDLDLAASNEILSYSPAQVEVEPFLMVVATQDDGREHRVRGLLTAVDTDAATISLALRPMRVRSGEFGTLVFSVSDDTVYEIDGIEYSGSEGLALIAALDASSPLLAYGNLDDSGDFTATQVIAGLGVAWSGDDVVKGVITARTDNTLTIGNVVTEHHNQSSSFASSTDVMIADTTTVTGYYEGDATITDLSVGQKVLITGTMTSTTAGSQFDASNGLVRMQLNQIVGTGTSTSPLTLDLLSINNQSADRFDFSGSSSSSEADMDAYQIATGALDLSNLEGGEWLSVRGYPTAWAHNGDDDFTALTVEEVSFATSIATYVSHWDTASSTAVTISDNSLVIDNTNAIDRLSLSGVPKTLVASLVVNRITGATDGAYAIQITGTGSSIYLTYTDFLTALATALTNATTNGEAVSHMSAQGSFDETTGILTATHIMVRIGTIENRHSDNIRSQHSDARSADSHSGNPDSAGSSGSTGHH
jgi:hypothetical protein